MDANKKLAVALGEHPKANNQIIVGDMFETETWQKVKEWAKGSKFALVLCKPIGAFGYKHEISSNAFDFLVGNVIEQMEDGGHFFVQLPVNLMRSEQDFALWIELKYQASVKKAEDHSAFEIIIPQIQNTR